MRKIPLTLLILGLTVIALFAYNYWDEDPKGSQEWKTYSNSRYSFSVNYPANWTLGEKETNNAGRIFYSPEKKVECYAYGFANALNQDLNEFIEWWTKDETEEEKFYTEVLKEKQTTLDGKEAIYLSLNKDGKLWEAVYTLNQDRGLGLYCIYQDKQTKESFTNIFQKMKDSFKLEQETTFMGKDCAILLNGMVEPLKDRQTFTDEEYTGVTVTSREYWDQTKLPQRVKDLQSQNYTCYPMPLEYSDRSGKVQPEVTKVEWSCELEYDEWYYLSEEDSTLLSSYQSKGFNCEKQECFKDNGQIGHVWLCAK